MAKLDIFLGLDGGGTQCRAILCDKAGTVLGRGHSGPANILTNSQQARVNILDAVGQALFSANMAAMALSNIPAFMGIAGANISSAAKTFRKMVPFKQCVIDTDAAISLEGAIGSQEGVVAIIGTGAIYIYRYANITKTIDGWGFALGDFASGAWLGRKLLQETLRAFDGIHQPSALTDFVFGQFNNDPQAIVEYAHNAKPHDFGTFAPVIFEYARIHDVSARNIIAVAVKNIEEVLGQIVRDKSACLCLMGGLGPHYAEFLKDDYRRQLVTPQSDPVMGAVRLAIKHFGDTNICNF